MSEPSDSGSVGVNASRRGGGRLAQAFGALVLSVASDAEPRQEASPCRVSGVAVQVFASSRLFEAPGDRLELLAGRQLDCGSLPVRQVLAALEPALASLANLDESFEARSHSSSGASPEGIARGRFAAPLRVHLDPALPSRQAPLAAIEVHVSRRELLVARSVLGELGPEVWRHELLHTIAAPPPEGAGPARRLWLTLEEGLVEHVERASTRAGPAALPSDGVAIENSDAVAIETSERAASVLLAQRALPAAALLADPAYDPHPLAAGLARELERGGLAVPVGAWVDCLAARPSALPARAAASDVFRAFAGRCSLAAANELSRAVGRWWVEAEPPPASLASVRKAAARAGDSR
jgi:hypothetical protein